jgi:hypothetical protein
MAGGDGFDKGIDEPAVDLEEGAVVDAVVEVGGAVGEGGCSPAGDGLRGCINAGFGKELGAGEGGNALLDGFRELVKASFIRGSAKRLARRAVSPASQKRESSEGRRAGVAWRRTSAKACAAVEEQRGGDGALLDGNDGVGAAAAVAGFPAASKARRMRLR